LKSKFENSKLGSGSKVQLKNYISVLLSRMNKILLFIEGSSKGLGDIKTAAFCDQLNKELTLWFEDEIKITKTTE